MTATLSELRAELTALQAYRADMTEPQTEAEFDAMASECIGMGEVEGELMFAIQQYNYHAAIEAARKELDGTAEKYDAFLELVQAYLTSEGV
jgi:hypothetical protein